MRRFGFGHPERREDPGAVLVAQHAEATGLAARRTRDDDRRDGVLDGRVGHPDLVGGVADADLDGVFAWPVEAPLVQPGRQAGAAPGRVDHEVGVDHRGLRVIQSHARHPLPIAIEQWNRGHTGGDGHGVHRVDASPELPFQVGATGHVGGEIVAQRVSHPEDVTGGAEVDGVGPVLQHRHTGGDHVVEQAGEQGVEFERAARHQ